MTRSFLMLALLAVFALPARGGEMQTVKLFIPQMTGCPSCPYIVQSVLSGLDGVDRVETVYKTGIATVVYDDERAALADFRKALEEYGYDPEQVTPEG